MVTKKLNGKHISTSVKESKFGTMHIIESESNGVKTSITLFTDGSVVIHNCSNVIIYNEDIESVEDKTGVAGEYKIYNFKEKA